MILKRKSNYLIRKLFQETNGDDDNEEYEDVTIEVTKLVEVTRQPTTTRTTDLVMKNITSTINPLSTSTTMSDFEKNKEMFEEAAKKLKSK
jgi:hypothetical protein